MLEDATSVGEEDVEAEEEDRDGKSRMSEILLLGVNTLELGKGTSGMLVIVG